MNNLEVFKKFSENLDGKLSIEESIKNIEESLVEIVYPNGSHRGNGLLMADNGYFLTAYHCLDYAPIYIRDFNGNFYPIKEISRKDSIRDIAIARAEINVNPNPKRYNILNAENLKKYCDRKYQICLKTFREGEIEDSYGFLKNSSKTILLEDGYYHDDQFTTSIITKEGDSGGIAMSHNGELMGFLSTSMPVSFENFEFSYFSKASSAMAWINLKRLQIS